MQTAAKINLVLTNPSSLKRFADPEAPIRHGGFYQYAALVLARGGYTNRVLRETGDRLVVLAEHAHAFREMDKLEQVSQVLMNASFPGEHKAVGRYFQALCVQRLGFGDLEKGEKLLETIDEAAPIKYRVRALISLAAGIRARGNAQSALSLYGDAARFISLTGLYDPYAAIHTQKMFAVIGSEGGNHRDALKLLENLFPLANAMRSTHPHVYYDYMNSLAVELCEVGRIEEARNVSRIVLASPFAGAYPEWRETRDEIEIRGWRAPRSEVALGQSAFKSENLVQLPVREGYQSLGATEQTPLNEPARVLSLQRWKERMPKQSNGDLQHKTASRPTTTEEKRARFKELEELTTREKLLRLMNLAGDERVGDDLLLRALVILEDLESEENQGT